ncbi:uncharacterized protein ARMOST_20545 [Armillaria ostoyae]|uniref:Uncharacterized protein n=1 Tax=Armillaria ostoyae TaxID=47428 RepID=A0A284S7M6_ARMOS|nr:uncharacterized protein ARMOST_20545 [Armillaria ostoyae]
MGQTGIDRSQVAHSARPSPHPALNIRICEHGVDTHSDGSYSIVVNGKEIGAGNGYHTSAVYTVGLEPEGNNVFAIAVNNTGGAGGLNATIRVDYSDGTNQTIVTDTTWKTIKATPPGGWKSPSFNDSAWIAASEEKPGANKPWGMPPLPPVMTHEHGRSELDQDERDFGDWGGPSWSQIFRKTIVSPYGKAAVCGKVVVTADDEYTLYVNGNKIGSGNNWVSMQAYSIPIMNADKNLIAVDSVNTKPNVAGLIGVIAGVLVAYNDGTTETLYTDDSWKTLAATSPAGFEATDLDDSSWISAKKWMHGGSPTVPPASESRVALDSRPVNQRLALYVYQSRFLIAT